MIMSNFLRNRKSVREFKKKKVDTETLNKIRSSMDSLVEEQDSQHINFILYENGEHIYNNLEGKGGYSGVMISSPHYIGLELKDDENKTRLNGAYYMEKLITDLNNMGISTCWVSIPDTYKVPKLEALGYAAERIDYVLALGYEKLRNPFNTEPSSARLAVEELVFDGEIETSHSINELENRGLLDIFHYVRYAPSMLNLQPWRFLIEGNTIKLLLAYKNWDSSLLVDAGIIMYYFEELVKTLGIINKWELVDEVDHQGKNNNYKMVAEYQL